eukprot:TRINITY_DN3011_c0_g1_i2.p1 TRINITY_DN3011_c0_g1~~TRINITY_DN3011_c0_g1_i2.p1  ORF type:complete len:875 (-),score=266.26 TRINITY_DN3011_c0_g1_i2:14-2563(-)
MRERFMKSKASPEAKNYVEFEKEHNRLLRSLRSEENKSLLSLLVDQKTSALLVPQQVSIETLRMSTEFIKTHIIVLNPLDSLEFISLSGVRGVLSPTFEEVVILSGPPEDPRLFHAFLENPISLFKDRSIHGKWHWDKPWPRAKREELTLKHPFIQVLRHTSVVIDGFSIPMMIVSGPVVYEGRTHWEHIDSIDGFIMLPRDDAPPTSKPIPMSDKAVPMKEASARQRMVDLLAMFSNQGPATVPEDVTSPMEPLFGAESRESLDPPTPMRAMSLIFPSTKGVHGTSTMSIQEFLQRARKGTSHRIRARIVRFVRKVLERGSSQSVPQIADSVHHFMYEIDKRMSIHPDWKNCTAAEWDIVRDGVERLVMHQLHDLVFSGSEDFRSRDANLERRIRRLSFIRPAHLEMNDGFLGHAGWAIVLRNFRTLNTVRTPRDKMYLIASACEVLFVVLQHTLGKTVGADEFFPAIVFALLRANPPALHSNIDYVEHFRHPLRLDASHLYYLTNIKSAAMFIEQLDDRSLAMDHDEFERKWQRSMDMGEDVAFSSSLSTEDDLESLGSSYSVDDIMSVMPVVSAGSDMQPSGRDLESLSREDMYGEDAGGGDAAGSGSMDEEEKEEKEEREEKEETENENENEKENEKEGEGEEKKKEEGEAKAPQYPAIHPEKSLEIAVVGDGEGEREKEEKVGDIEGEESKKADGHEDGKVEEGESLEIGLENEQEAKEEEARFWSECPAGKKSTSSLDRLRYRMQFVEKVQRSVTSFDTDGKGNTVPCSLSQLDSRLSSVSPKEFESSVEMIFESLPSDARVRLVMDYIHLLSLHCERRRDTKKEESHEEVSRGGEKDEWVII